MGFFSEHGWLKFEDVVAAARRSAWRTTARDAAVAAGEHQGVTHLVYDVIDPGTGPAFVCDLSREQRFLNSETAAEQNAKLAVLAVTWLPGLAEENRQARQLLKASLGGLPIETAAQVKAFLDRPGVEEAFDSDLASKAAKAAEPSW